MIEIINKQLLLHLVGYLYYWQMGFNSVFKGLSTVESGYNDIGLCDTPYITLDILRRQLIPHC